MKPWQNWIEGSRLARMLSGDRRRAARHSSREIRAYFWDGGPPGGREIADINSTGLYLRTTARWYPGTLITMTLQKTEGPEDDAPVFLSVQTRIMRWGEDGVGCQFIFPTTDISSDAGGNGGIAKRDAIERFLK